jgi:2-polyprenyl-3-methyl-5-hydroxy-6-metoxy-1,4-benzoquinol methylase
LGDPVSRLAGDLNLILISLKNVSTHLEGRIMAQDYALGHTDAEMRRLTTQARLIDPITRRFFEAAGLKAGMRVLDVGSGAGDVAVLVADIVGPGGEVLGTDISAVAVKAAEARTKSAGLKQIEFRQGDPAAMAFEAPFDAVVGRYVLQFIPDPHTALEKIALHVKPGGIVVFHELDWGGARSSPLVPTYERVCKWISSTIEAAGARTRLGTGLAPLFEAAGLPPPSLRLESVIASGPAAIDVVHLVTDLVEILMPSMEQFGVATKDEIGHADLVGRIMVEIGTAGTLIGRAEVGAWTVKAG